MNTSVVGASILNIITESLYDKPIVIFREYVQNSVDSLLTIKNDSNKDKLYNYIWQKDNNLYFLDNGSGIEPQHFISKMESIAFSSKTKTSNIGYKGIGRLSGMSYCEKLHFVNIVNFENKDFQEYIIDCNEYNNIQNLDEYNQMSFHDLMHKIGTLNTNISSEQMLCIIEKYAKIFESSNSGFLVVLEGISSVLKNIINDKKFCNELSWLLPVPFKDELFVDDKKSLFNYLSFENAFEKTDIIAAQSFNIFFNDKQLMRPLNKGMLRTYLCKSNFENYAICITSFSNEKIEIDKNNPFSGIRIYIDNMLLCDENELIPMLQQYGFIRHGLYEMIQTVKGIGMIIYIVDKVNLSANARRTFIELTDPDSLHFLELISTYIEDVYNTRYALSHYARALKKGESTENIINEKREKALHCLEKLARDEVVVEVNEQEGTKKFDELSVVEQKRIIKTIISKEINNSLKSYLDQATSFNFDSCIDDFKTWYTVN